MEPGPHESRLQRLKARFKRPLRRSSPAPPQSTSAEPAYAESAYDDRTRVQRRYEDAVKKLEDVLQYRNDGWKSFDLDIPDAKTPGTFDDAVFQTKLNAVLKAHADSITDKNGWQKFTHAIECAYTVFSPFAKTFLSVAIHAQSVLRPDLFFSDSL
jgi:hypothetical protein